MTPLLEVKGISKAYGGVQAVGDVSFQLGRGEILALIGPNGAGKSTCFGMLSGQIAPDDGDVLFEGQSIMGLRPRAIWRLGIGRTFQITATFASMTVAENVQMALMSDRLALGRLWGFAGGAQRAEAERLLGLVGMDSDIDRPSATLAYGDLRRLELAIALANEPKLLLMDEPTAGMAPSERVQLMRLTSEVAREHEIGVLFTEHDMDVVFEHADRVMVLSRGRLIAEGSPQAVRQNEEVRAVYLGGGTTYDARHQGASEHRP
jgi:branched-chain amino acid transport system ATP-binding protein